MKIKYFILFAIMLSVSIDSFCQKQIDVPYDFPIKPGSEEWTSFSTGRQMVEACQIPSDILGKLSTKALAETCLNYPLFFEYSAVNDERIGAAHIISNFNGLQELIKREDGVKELIALYEKIPIVKNERKNGTIVHVGYLELLLSDNRFFDKMTDKELIDLKKTGMTKYEEKVKSKERYGMYGIQKSLLLVSKIKIKTEDSFNSSKDKEMLNKFINLYDTSSPEVFTEVSKIVSK